MPLWRATVTYFTAAKGVREWKGEVEAETTEAACEAAVRAAKRERPQSIAEIVDPWVEPLGARP